VAAFLSSCPCLSLGEMDQVRIAKARRRQVLFFRYMVFRPYRSGTPTETGTYVALEGALENQLLSHCPGIASSPFWSWKLERGGMGWWVGVVRFWQSASTFSQLGWAELKRKFPEFLCGVGLGRGQPQMGKRRGKSQHVGQFPPPAGCGGVGCASASCEPGRSAKVPAFSRHAGKLYKYSREGPTAL
jgi:hypothetical protein